MKHAIRNGVMATLHTKIIGAHSGLIFKKTSKQRKTSNNNPKRYIQMILRFFTRKTSSTFILKINRVGYVQSF